MLRPSRLVWSPNPPRSLPKTVVKCPLVNIQFAIKDEVVYVIEANPRVCGSHEAR